MDPVQVSQSYSRNIIIITFQRTGNKIKVFYLMKMMIYDYVTYQQQQQKYFF